MKYQENPTTEGEIFRENEKVVEEIQFFLLADFD
jgi:hypothetical protein